MPYDLPAAGRFESERFDPAAWVPEYPNPAFENAQPEDDFWMARQIAALRDGDIDALVETGRYSDPKVAAYAGRVLWMQDGVIGGQPDDAAQHA